MRSGARRVAVGVVGLLVVGALMWWLFGDGPKGDVSEPESRDVSVRERSPQLLSATMTDATPTNPSDAHLVDDVAQPDPSAKEARIVGVVRRAGTDEGVDVGDMLLDLKGFVVSGTRVPFATDARGEFALTLATHGKAEVTRIDSKDDRWRCHTWHPKDGVPGDTIRVVPGETAHVIVSVVRMLRVRGTVTDESGVPVAGARVQFTNPQANGSKTWSAMIGTTSASGTFRMMVLEDPASVLSESGVRTASTVQVTANGFGPRKLNVHEFDLVDSQDWHITLSRGLTVRGVLVDGGGQPVPHAPVEIVYDKDHQKRRSAVTDSNGAFVLQTVTAGALRLRALALPQKLEADEALTLNESVEDVQLVAHPIAPQEEGVYFVMGLRVENVTDATRKASNLPEHVRVVIRDSGPLSARLGAGYLAAGMGLWKIGNTSVESVKHLVDLLLAEHKKSAKARPKFPWVRLVYVYGGSGDYAGWSNTQPIFLSEADVASLRQTQEALR